MIQGSPITPANWHVSGADLETFFRLSSRAPIGIAVYSGPSFILRFVSDQTLEAWDRKREEVAGKPLFEIFSELLQSPIARIMRNVYETGERYKGTEFEVTYRKNGEIVTGFFDFALEPVPNVDGTLDIIAAISETTEKVTQRKKLAESEARFRALASEAPLLVWVTDKELRTVYANRTCLKYFDLLESVDLSTLSWKNFIHPDDLDRVLKTMFEAVKNRTPYSLEMRLKDGATGKYRWFLDQGSPQYVNNVFKGFVGTSLDIHDRREQEERLEQRVRERTDELHSQNHLLKKQNELVQKVLDSTLDLIAVYDTDMRILAVNRAALQLIGMNEEDVIGKNLIDVFPEFSHAKNSDDLARALRGETIHNSHYQTRISGKYYENLLVPLRTEDNSIYAVLAMAHDNTILIKKNEELNDVQHIAQLGSWDWDPVSGVVNWSEQMYHIYGLEPKKAPINIETAMGRMDADDIKKTRQRVNGHMEEARRLFAETGEPVFNSPPLEYSITLSDGSKKVLKGTSKIILSPDGTVSKIIGTVLDITESIRQVQELKKLYESDQLKSDFIKMASHELKTPVTSIKGYVQLLLDALSKDSDTERSLSPLLVRSSLISIDKQTARLTRLMSELLDLSKIETGRLELNRELISLNEVVIETVQDILYTNSKHVIKIFHDFECNVFADKDRIGQVLINLLTNAIKYSPKADQIEVWIRKAAGNNVSVSVRDYGIGIDSQDRERIFERFYRAQGKEEQTFPGFGIGLFIATEITVRHGGSIDFESEKGKGSTFTFTLPLPAKNKE